jgi:hypothetical protein
MRSMVGLLIVALIAVLMYKFYFSRLESSGTGAGTPKQTIDVVGVKNDLIGIAQAERAYQAENGAYASTLDELTSSGALSMSYTGRDGYTYHVETSESSFRAVAQCPAATSPRCTSWAVDESMEVQPVP